MEKFNNYSYEDLMSCLENIFDYFMHKVRDGTIAGHGSWSCYRHSIHIHINMDIEETLDKKGSCESLGMEIEDFVSFLEDGGNFVFKSSCTGKKYELKMEESIEYKSVIVGDSDSQSPTSYYVNISVEDYL